MTPVEKIAPRPGLAPQRTMRIFIRDLVLSCRIGIHQHERLASQRIRLNLEVLAQEHPAIGDDLDRVLCYAELMSGIKALIAEGHVNLIETLAGRIADYCLEDRRVLAAKVRIDKLDVFKEAESVGIEIERRRDIR